MVYKALTAARRVSLVRFLRLAMRRLPILPAALCAAIGLPAAAPAWAESPVVIEGPDNDTIIDTQRRLGLGHLSHIPRSYAGLIRASLEASGDGRTEILF